jgi:predicted nucleic acid-binding Zn finger protein
MLRNEDIKKIDELKTNFTHRWFEVDYVMKVIDIFKFSSLLKSFSHFKKQGYNFKEVLSILLILPFVGITNINLMQYKKFKAKKDVFYRLKNKPLIDWRSILWLFVIKFVNIVAANASDTGNIKCLIIDDSFLEKSGRYIEKISRMWDHVSKRYILGFKLNVMSLWDGVSFIPIDFALHREKGKNKKKPYGLTKKELKKQFSKKREKGVGSYERAKEADQTKIETGIKMFKRAIKRGLQFDYLLMDSWYTCNEFIELVRSVKKQTIHLIGMYKIAKTIFTYNDKSVTYSQLRNLLGKPKRNRKTGYYYLEAVVLLKGKSVKLFFSKKGKNGKWKTILTTNTDLSFIKMLEIYAIRWSIEVFFKEGKQLLSLGKDQANDFDSQIASATLVMMQYILISTRYRFDNYESKGELFRQAKVEIFRENLSNRLWGLLLEILNMIIEIFENEDADELIEKMFHDEKVYQKIENFINFSKIAA